MHSSLRYLPNEPQYVALMHGPILLGMKTGTESMASLIADDSRFGQYAGGPKQPIDKAPILINNDIASIPSQLTPVQVNRCTSHSAPARRTRLKENCNHSSKFMTLVT